MTAHLRALRLRSTLLAPVVLASVASGACNTQQACPPGALRPPLPGRTLTAAPAVSQSAQSESVPESLTLPDTTAQTHRDPWRANDDPSDNGVDGPPEVFADCESRLTAAGVTWRKATLAVHPAAGGKHTCGAPQVVLYERGPTGIGWNSPIVTCGMAIAMARFERILREESMKYLKHTVHGVLHGVPYQCRSITDTSVASEHSYGNGVDVFGFVLDDGRKISVLLQFGPTAETSVPPEGQFLRSLAHRLHDEGIFSNVLTPYFNAAHRDHIHVDLGRYRVDGTR